VPEKEVPRMGDEEATFWMDLGWVIAFAKTSLIKPEYDDISSLMTRRIARLENFILKQEFKQRVDQ
jgi:hypothetical protein